MILYTYAWTTHMFIVDLKFAVTVNIVNLFVEDLREDSPCPTEYPR